MTKQGIIIASFGSVYQDAVEKSIGAMESKVKSIYGDVAIRRVFLSDALVEKWNEKYDTRVMTLQEALQSLRAEDIEEVYIQPFALVSDQCYQQMRKQVMKMIHTREYGFTQIAVGKPLLTSLGVKNYADDYTATIEAIVKHVSTKAIDKAIVLMANGQNQLEFSALQLKCLYGAAPNMVVFTANGFPNFKQALHILNRISYQDILVVPLALIGSTHLMDYLGGDRSDSIYALLTEEGYSVSIWNEGLGENPYIQELFLKHLSQTMRMAERRRSACKSEDSVASVRSLA
ncbi:sirohydrochlorin cobaltochelatase [Veillonella montpellierensis]|uniref:sirohydrochlorin cobaltochelatase n=1 Tax=Veillonella montpellierensis TaxID=187328 RepID=UPI0003FA20ED|nr:sirohydrochlorin cobaltochelatase [Veillonella montpellierensis]